MAEISTSPYGPPPLTPAPARRRVKPVPLYPLAEPFTLAGVVAAVLMLALLGSIPIAVGTFVLFAVCGHTWRRDMPPIIPFCFAFQWVGAFLGSIYFEIFGQFPGDTRLGDLDAMMYASALGFVAAAIGIRMGMALFARSFHQTLNAPYPPLDLNRLAQFTIILFAFSYIFNIVPTALWFGGAQIISNLLTIRFVPFFVLLLLVFERGTNYRLLILTTLVVLMPQLLTGFSDFKELFFTIFLAAVYQWRPWIKTPQQRRRNKRLLAGAIIGAFLILSFGIIWKGGVKQQWRDVLWWSQSAESSPLARMGQFVAILGDVVTTIDIEYASGQLVARMSSGSLYVSMVMDRIPAVIPHEGGALLYRAVENAVVPRFLFPNKAVLSSDSDLVRQYAGIYVAGAESNASIGLGYMAEFYIDFGWVGVIALCTAYGLLLMGCFRLFAWAAPTGTVFIALTLGFMLAYFSVYDSSFIKLLAGLIQRAVLVSVAVAIFAPMVMPWLMQKPARTPPAGRRLPPRQPHAPR